MNKSLRLVVSGLACQRGERLLFEGLDFALRAGEAMALTGPNGVGKTTLLRAILGFLPPLAGQIRLEGGEAEAAVADHAHWLGHRDGLKAALTVRENLAFAAALLGGGDGLAPEAAAERLALRPLLDLPVGALSAGQRRRAALARLLAAPRPLWLLDEPTAALDAASQALVAGLIADHAAAGGLVLAATHLPLGLAARELRLEAAA